MKPVDSATNERIKEIMTDLEYPLESFARKIGVSKGVFERITLNESRPSISVLNKIIKTFPVERQWLWLGQGKKYTKSITKLKFDPDEVTTAVAVYGDETKGGRIRYVRGVLEYSQVQLAEELGTTRDVLAQIEIGKNAPQSYVLERLHNLYGVNINWILAGTGDVFANQDRIKETKKRALMEELRKLEE